MLDLIIVCDFKFSINRHSILVFQTNIEIPEIDNVQK